MVGDGATHARRRDPGQVIPVDELKHAFGADAAGPRSRSSSPTDAACIVWTSGTTGAPEGRGVRPRAHGGASRATSASSRGPATAGCVVLPFPHVGYMTRMWDELANATTIVLAGEPWSAGETLRLIRDEGITMATGVPTQWQLVLDHPDVARTDFSGAARRRASARPRSRPSSCAGCARCSAAR